MWKDIESGLFPIKVKMFYKDKRTRIPRSSFLFTKIIPAVLILMAIVTASLILFAVGILLGIIRF